MTGQIIMITQVIAIIQTLQMLFRERNTKGNTQTLSQWTRMNSKIVRQIKAFIINFNFANLDLTNPIKRREFDR